MITAEALLKAAETGDNNNIAAVTLLIGLFMAGFGFGLSWLTATTRITLAVIADAMILLAAFMYRSAPDAPSEKLIEISGHHYRLGMLVAGGAAIIVIVVTIVRIVVQAFFMDTARGEPLK